MILLFIQCQKETLALTRAELSWQNGSIWVNLSSSHKHAVEGLVTVISSAFCDLRSPNDRIQLKTSQLELCETPLTKHKVGAKLEVSQTCPFGLLEILNWKLIH